MRLATPAPEHPAPRCCTRTGPCAHGTAEPSARFGNRQAQRRARGHAEESWHTGGRPGASERSRQASTTSASRPGLPAAGVRVIHQLAQLGQLFFRPRPAVAHIPAGARGARGAGAAGRLRVGCGRSPCGSETCRTAPLERLASGRVGLPHGTTGGAVGLPGPRRHKEHVQTQNWLGLHLPEVGHALLLGVHVQRPLFQLKTVCAAGNMCKRRTALKRGGGRR